MIFAAAFRDFPALPEMEFSHTGWHVLLVGCYLPLLLWPPLLAAVTVSYHRRRSTPGRWERPRGTDGGPDVTPARSPWRS